MNVWSVTNTGCGQVFGGLAPCHEQRNPIIEFAMIFGIAHTVKQVMRTHGLIALAEESHILIAKYEAHVRNAPDKMLRMVNDTMRNQVGPKFFGKFKGLGDLDGFADIYRPICPL